MTGQARYRYVIVGGGLAGASAVEGIRQLDPNGPILLVSDEKHLPYHRPPLSKDLWFGKKKLADIYVHDGAFYEDRGVSVVAGARIVALDARDKTITAANGQTYRFDKLLLATGGKPKRLSIPGGESPDLCYFRHLDDYMALHERAGGGASALVVGGGFIGSEMAAALAANDVHVTMLYPAATMCDRVFPPSLGAAMKGAYRKRGIEIITGDKPARIERSAERFVTITNAGRRIESDHVVVGVGISPEVTLAASAGLKVSDGIEVNAQLQSSNPDIYAAGDNALFPYAALEQIHRVEHWDNALNQGRQAGRNMAGAGEAYTYMPYFFSDLFDFGYEAVGEANSSLEVFTDWQEENVKGTIYYLRDGRVRGVMMCNVWDKVPAAREMIRQSDRVGSPAALAGAIR